MGKGAVLRICSIRNEDNPSELQFNPLGSFGFLYPDHRRDADAGEKLIDNSK